jgi:hypothetical protein
MIERKKASGEAGFCYLQDVVIIKDIVVHPA